MGINSLQYTYFCVQLILSQQYKRLTIHVHLLRTCTWKHGKDVNAANYWFQKSKVCLKPIEHVGENTVSGNSWSTWSWTLNTQTNRQTRNSETQGSSQEQPAGCLDLYRFTRSTIATMTVATAAGRQSLNWASTSPAAGMLLAAADILPAAAAPPPAGAGGKEEEEDRTLISLYRRKALVLPFLTASPIPLDLHHPCWITSLSQLQDHLSR